MNEMRKLMEAVESIEEGEKTAESVLSYFNGYAGGIKDGYIAKYASDQGDEWVTNIHEVNSVSGDDSRTFAINRWHVGENTLINHVRIYRLQKVL